MSWFPNQLVAIKPHPRGWLRLVAASFSLTAPIVLVALVPTTPEKWASAIHLAAPLLLFGISALYYCFYWKLSWEVVWRRLGHSNIFLLIARTYTPLAVVLLNSRDQIVLLSTAWTGAAAGILANLFWPSAPQWLSTSIYVVPGWTVATYLPQLWTADGATVIILIVVGGPLYTLGALVYSMKRPNPSSKWSDFHGIFHAFTVVAWACRCIAACPIALARPFRSSFRPAHYGRRRAYVIQDEDRMRARFTSACYTVTSETPASPWYRSLFILGALMVDAQWSTQAQHDLLKEKLRERVGVKRSEIAKLIGAVRQEEDPREDGGYHAACSEQSMDETRA